MKKIMTMVLFVLFVLLCGAEILPKFMASAQKERGAVLYVRSVDQHRPGKSMGGKAADYRALIKDINVNGA